MHWLTFYKSKDKLILLFIYTYILVYPADSHYIFKNIHYYLYFCETKIHLFRESFWSFFVVFTYKLSKTEQICYVFIDLKWLKHLKQGSE